MRGILLVVLVAVLTFPFGMAQAAAPAAPLKRPILTGEDNDPIAGVRLVKVDVQSAVRGATAQTSITLTFANDTIRVLGGTLTFPLPENAAVIGYALDINGVLVDGVAVDKERARVAYETEMRRKVDPGLVEHVRGNVFRTRVYPIPANGARIVQIRYLSDIVADGKGSLFSIPMPWEGALDDFRLRVDIDADHTDPAAAAPVLRRQPVPDTASTRTARGWQILASAQKGNIGGELAIALPALSKQIVQIERWPRSSGIVEDTAAGDKPAVAKPDEHFFVIRDTPQPENRPAQAAARRIGVLWDASLSRANTDKKRELELLKKVCALLGDVKVDLFVFRDVAEPAVTFDIRDGKADKLLAHLQALTYDGGTNLAIEAVADAAGTSWAGRAFYLLFSDGAGTFGPTTPAKLEVPVFTVANSNGANPAVLERIARVSGGAFLNLPEMTDDEAAATAGNAPFSLVSVNFDPAQIADLTPAGGQFIRNGVIQLSGRLLAPSAKLTLNYGYGQFAIHRETITLQTAGAPEGGTLAVDWARRRVAELSAEPELNRAALLKLGREFNLVTPETSLLVLETVDQYVRHNVVPPKTRPEMYASYKERVGRYRTEEERARDAKLTYAIALWDQRVKWWETNWKEAAIARAELEAAEAKARAAAALDAAADRNIAARTGRPAGMRLQSDAEKDAQARANGGGYGGGGGGGGGLFGSSGAASASPNVQRAYSGDLAGPPNSLANTPAAPAAPKHLADSTKERETVVATIAPWDPQMVYVEAMRRVGPKKAYDVYLEQRKTFGNSPAFYVDCADYLLRYGSRPLGIRVLSSILELQANDPRLLRIAAHRLQQVGEHDLAIELFERVVHVRPEEPQSLRDLALALADRADALIAPPATLRPGVTPTPPLPGPETDRAKADYVRAMDLLNKVVLNYWQKFAEIETTALMECNRILARARRLPGQEQLVGPLDPRLVKNLDLDLRVVLTWDADNADVELIVTEPGGDRAVPNAVSWAGGMVSRPMSAGYGPQEYCLRRLKAGSYKIQAKYLGGRQQDPTGPVTIQATIITNFGRPDEKRQYLTARAKEARDVIDLGTVRLGR